MGGLISVIISVLAAFAFYGTGHPLLFGLCLVIVILSFWSWGIMHNYALNSANARWDRIRENMIREGRSSEEIDNLDSAPIHLSEADVDVVPDWLATLNLLATLAGIGLLIWGIIVRFF